MTPAIALATVSELMGVWRKSEISWGVEGIEQSMVNSIGKANIRRTQGSLEGNSQKMGQYKLY
jgi:hypothetical protein